MTIVDIDLVLIKSKSILFLNDIIFQVDTEIMHNTIGSKINIRSWI